MQVALKFPRPFWRSATGEDADFFGHVSDRRENRGLFGVFYDLSPSRGGCGHKEESDCALKSGDEGCHVLVSTVSGQALQRYSKMTDEEVLHSCLQTLRLLFPRAEVPVPTQYLLSRWGRDPHIGMSYSYVGVGASGQDYDALAKEERGKLYFAGEVCVWDCH